VRVQRFFALLLTAGALLWTATLFLTPFALVGMHPRVVSAAAFVYEGAGRICHQISDRSFRVAGVQQPVCARCTGLYVSGAVGALAAWFGASRRTRVPRHTRAAFVLAAFPTAFTVILEFAGLASPSSGMRALSAIPLGAVAGWVFVRSLRAEAVAREDAL
jgi:uncharacterized membrane protein